VRRHVELDLGPHAERLGEDVLHDGPDAGIRVAHALLAEASRRG